MASKPMPPIVSDPSVLAGQAIKADYPKTASSIRGDFNLSPLAKAEAVVQAWEDANAQLSAAYVDLQSRRQARLDYVGSLVPSGPAIPADASPADRALLQQLWRNALNDARNASDADRAAMLRDAETYDDDTQRRAVLTALGESGEYADQATLNEWAESHGISAEMAEAAALRDGLAGRGFDNLTVNLALSLIPQPSEVSELPRLTAARDAAKAAGQRTGRFQ